LNLASLLSVTSKPADDPIIAGLRRRIAAYSEDEQRDKDGKWSKGDSQGELFKTVKPDEAKADDYLKNIAKKVVLYHGTAQDAVDHILKEGIVPGKSSGGDDWAKENMGIDMGRDRPVSAFATTSKDNALRYASIAAESRHAVPVVVRMAVPEDVFKASFKFDEQQLSGDAFRTETPLPASWITGIAKGKFNDAIDPEYIGYNMMPVQHVTLGRFTKPKVSATGMKTVYFVIMADGTKAVSAYSDDEARDKDGKWTKGGDNEIFVSPNVKENLGLQDAIRSLASDRQMRFEAKARDVVAAVAGGGKVEGAIGVWADGAENSTAITVPNADSETLRYTASLLGKSGDQKAVLAWTNTVGGPHALYTLSTSLGPTQVAADSLKLGIAFQTIIPSYHGGRIQILDQDGSLADKVQALGSMAGYKPVGVQHGSGEFIGSWTSRDEGNAAYDQIIQAYEKGHQGYKGSLEFSGADGKHGWSDLYRRIAAAKAAAEETEVEAYSEDEARDEGGKWTTGGRAEQLVSSFPHGDHPHVRLDLKTVSNPDRVRIGYLATNTHGKGHASKAMNALTTLADKLHVPMELTVASRGDAGDLEEPDLIKFYEHHGFVRQPDYSGFYSFDGSELSKHMVREPGAIKAYSEDEQRDKNGEWSSGGNDRAATAKRTYNPATLEKQKIADEAEMRLSKAVGIPRTRDNSAFDLVDKGVAVEVKTLVDRKRDEITMHPDALRRKQKEARKIKVNAYTVVMDERPGQNQVYWKAGVGSFTLSSMNRVSSVEGLRKVLVPR
jgi:hypothetical protein